MYMILRAEWWLRVCKYKAPVAKIQSQTWLETMVDVIASLKDAIGSFNLSLVICTENHDNLCKHKCNTMPIPVLVYHKTRKLMNRSEARDLLQGWILLYSNITWFHFICHFWLRHCRFAKHVISHCLYFIGSPTSFTNFIPSPLHVIRGILRK